MKKVLIATTNKGKLKELSELLSDLPVQLVSLSDIGITEEPEENGKDYAENSQIKALFYSVKSGLPAIADDGGLEIAALGGAPGLKSHRWLGPETSEQDIYLHMKNIAKDLPNGKRQAFFKVVITLAFPDGTFKSFPGEIEGIIAKKPTEKYESGYPYRSFFYLPKLRKFYIENELTPDEVKNYHHRYQAVQKLKKELNKTLI